MTGFYDVYTLVSEADGRIHGLTCDLNTRLAEHNRGEMRTHIEAIPIRVPESARESFCVAAGAFSKSAERDRSYATILTEALQSLLSQLL